VDARRAHLWARYARSVENVRIAAVSYTDSSGSQKLSGQGLSRIGKKMIDDLQQFLPELTKWLRLTDEELLHQSFALLQSLLDCFKKPAYDPQK
jgi:hypothetical protein